MRPEEGCLRRDPPEEPRAQGQPLWRLEGPPEPPLEWQLEGPPERRKGPPLERSSEPPSRPPEPVPRSLGEPALPREAPRSH